MFTVDLLKGQGRPVRTKPQGVAIFVATFAVPVLIAMLMAGYYARNSVLISIHKQNVNNLDLQTKRLEDAIKFKESCEKEKAAAKNCLTEVASSIKKHSQWSLVLAALVENLPDSVVLNSLEVKRSVLKGKAAAAVSADKKNADLSVSVRTLKMRVSGNPSYNCDLEVKAFRDRLKASKFLGPRLEDVVIAAQGHDNVEGRDVVAYDIDCIFRPGI
jgi:Tfp pilus assembly protein PilN